jgi:hypothetical protein
VTVTVGVTVFVGVTVIVGVIVGVTVTVGVIVEVIVGVIVGVTVTVGVGVAVGVDNGITCCKFNPAILFTMTTELAPSGTIMATPYPKATCEYDKFSA